MNAEHPAAQGQGEPEKLGYGGIFPDVQERYEKLRADQPAAISRFERRHWWSLRRTIPVYDRIPSGSSSARGVRITERLARQIERS